MFFVLRSNMPQTTPYSSKFNPSAYSSSHSHRQPVEENYGGLHYRDNKLVSGSLEALIQLLVPTVDYYPDVSIQPLCFSVIITIISGWMVNVKNWLTLEIILSFLQRSYIFTFLLSSRLFLNPFELMSRVCYLGVDHHRVGDPQMDKVCA